MLVELLIDSTEKLCGFRPDFVVVENFFKKILKNELILSDAWIKSKDDISKDSRRNFRQKTKSSINEDYTNKRIKAFILAGSRYVVDTWIDLLKKLIDIMKLYHEDRSEAVLNLRGRKRPYFSKNPNDLRQPLIIKGTKIYFETNLNANSVVKISRDLIKLFGYDQKDLVIVAINYKANEISLIDFI